MTVIDISFKTDFMSILALTFKSNFDLNIMEQIISEKASMTDGSDNRLHPVRRMTKSDYICLLRLHRLIWAFIVYICPEDPFSLVMAHVN